MTRQPPSPYAWASAVATASEILLDSVHLDVPNRICFSNIEQFDAPFHKSMQEHVYLRRHVNIAPVMLVRMPGDCIMHKGGDFLLSAAGYFIREHKPPYAFDPVPIEKADCPVITDEALLVARFGIYTWGHWLGELLPKIVLAESAYPRRFRYVLPDSVLTDPHPEHPWIRIRESIEAYGIDASRILGIDTRRDYQFRAGFLIPNVWSDHLLHPGASEMMRTSLKLRHQEPGPEKIYLRRTPRFARRLENQADIERIAHQNGFVSCTPGALDFASQARIFCGARQVVGILGSDLTGLLYAPEGVGLLSMAPSNFGDRFFYALVLDRNGWMADVRGHVTAQDDKVEHKRSFRIDPRNFHAALDQIETKATPARPARSGGGKRTKPARKRGGAGQSVNWDSVPPLQGAFYIDVLREVHGNLRPATYFEIGTSTGTSLRLSSTDSIAIDPAFKLETDALLGKRVMHLFQMTSDEFFAAHHPRQILGQPISLAFLDGMHHFEFLLRDFMNVEANCEPGGLIVMHDCLPIDLHIARRKFEDMSRRALSKIPGAWAGDVWKVLPILRRYRPDLRIFCVDAPPTGLVFVRNLNPGSTVLRQAYDQAIREISHLDLAEYGIARLHSEFGVASTSTLWREAEGIKQLAF